MLIQLGYADAGALHEVEERVKKEIEAGVEFAEQSPMPEGPEALEGVFASDEEVKP
jgi:pyruvate dehydrogenase E1 component alpha subunit